MSSTETQEVILHFHSFILIYETQFYNLLPCRINNSNNNHLRKCNNKYRHHRSLGNHLHLVSWEVLLLDIIWALHHRDREVLQ